MSDFKLVKLIGSPVQITTTVKPKGAYDNATAYETGDSVSYLGSSYVASTATVGNLPTNSLYWQLLASKGDTGTSGAGYTHTQSTSSATWTVNHNLGFKPAVSVTTSGGIEILAEIIHVSINQTIIYLNNSITGIARFL